MVAASLEHRELTRRYLVVCRLRNHKIAGGYTARHFLDFADWCEKHEYIELAAEIHDALSRNDRATLNTIAAESDLQPEILDDVIAEVEDPIIYSRPNFRPDVPRYVVDTRLTPRRTGGGRAPRGRRSSSGAGRTRSPGRLSADDDPHEPPLARLPVWGRA